MGSQRAIANDAFPTAIPVADRWHLLKNLREALETMLAHKPSALKTAGQTVSEMVAEETAVSLPVDEDKRAPTPTKTRLTEAEQRRQARLERREARFQLVRQLDWKGYSQRAI